MAGFYCDPKSEQNIWDGCGYVKDVKNFLI